MEKKFITRIISLYLLFFLLLIIIVIRCYYLFVKNRDFLLIQGSSRIVRTIPINSHRGIITDRNGLALSVSTPVKSLWINPKYFVIDNLKINKLAKILQISPERLNHKIIQAKNKEFIFLQRQLSPEMVEKITKLQIKGINFQNEYKRFYPAGEVTSQLIGLTNIDNIGQEGIEYSLNDILQGSPGSQLVLKDRFGHIFKTVEQIKPAIQGKDIHLSIDLRIQYIAYRILKESVIKYNAAGGSLVLIDASTGEILADVNSPSQNPNDKRRHIKLENMRNRVITDTFEPGSTMKAFSMAAILKKNMPINTVIDTNPGWINIQHKIIHDVHNYGKLNLSEIIKKSSNIGIIKLILPYGNDYITNVFHKFGFSQTTNTYFKGESNGWINNFSSNDKVSLASLSIGYGISSNLLQLAQGYAILANNGIQQQLSFIKKNSIEKGKKIINPKIAKIIKSMLHSATEYKGTAYKARIKGFEIAGKTGTSRRVVNGNYDIHSHNAIFVGMAPYPNTRYVMAIIIRDPQKNGFYGGQIAAPIFARIMNNVLQLMAIYPNA